VVFDPAKTARGGDTHQAPAAVTTVALEGSWHIRIDPAIQPPMPETVVLPESFVFADPAGAVPVPVAQGTERPLQSWTSWGLTTFTGFVDYTKTFELEGRHGKIELDLGDARYVAEVWVNGKSAGARMWAPFRFDLTPHARKGANELRVRVGNLYCNAHKQAEDAGLVHMGPFYPRTPPEMYESGLLGPVVVRQTERP
jgi:hypothetical protein